MARILRNWRLHIRLATGQFAMESSVRWVQVVDVYPLTEGQSALKSSGFDLFFSGYSRLFHVTQHLPRLPGNRDYRATTEFGLSQWQ